MKVRVARFRAAFTGLKIENDIFGEGDCAVNHFHITGIHNGLWDGLPPTGKTIVMSGIAMVQFVNGRLVEEWEYFDELLF